MSMNGAAAESAGDWRATAEAEGLFLGVSPEDRPSLDRILEQFPSDKVRIFFLRWANDSDLIRNQGLLVQVFMLMFICLQMVDTELSNTRGSFESDMARVSEMVGQIEQATAASIESSLQLTQRTNFFKSHTDDIVDKVETAIDSLPDRVRDVMDRILDMMKKAAEQEAKPAAERGVEMALGSRMKSISDDLNITRDTLQVSAKALMEIATLAKTAKTATPFALGKIKLDRAVAQAAGWAAGIAFVLGVLVTHFVFPAQHVVELTPDEVNTFQQGAAFQAWWAHATPRERASAQAAIDQYIRASLPK